jgi:TRAP-type C4-dicarboxylate transport system substrate-binding protein
MNVPGSSSTGAKGPSLAALFLLLATPAFAQTTVIKMATLVPDGSQWHFVLKDMAEKWKKASGGTIVVRLYPGGVAGDDPDVLRKMRLGTLNAGLLTSVGLTEVDRSVYALGLPLAYDSYDEAYFVLERLRPRLEAALRAKGFVVLNWVDGGFTRFFSHTPVATPDDLRQHKLFSWAGAPEWTELWKSTGFNPVPLPATELGSALSAGLVTALGVPPQVAVISQYYTKARNMTDLPFQLLLGATVVNQATWEALPAGLRPALLEAAREAEVELRAEIRRSGAKDVDEMKKRGLNVVRLDAPARQAWSRFAQEFLAKMRGRILPAEAFDEALRARDEFRRRPTAPR